MAEFWREELARQIAIRGGSLGVYHRRLRRGVEIYWLDSVTCEEGWLECARDATVVALTNEIYEELLSLRKRKPAAKRPVQSAPRQLVARSA